MIPTYEQSCDALEDGTDNALHRFVFHFEDHNLKTRWRKMLEDVIHEQKLIAVTEFKLDKQQENVKLLQGMFGIESEHRQSASSAALPCIVVTFIIIATLVSAALCVSGG